MMPCSYCGREINDGASDCPDCGIPSDHNGRRPRGWAGFALWVGWCFFGLVVYYCFVDTAPHIQPADFSLLDAVLVALLLAPLAVVTYGYWLQHDE